MKRVLVLEKSTVKYKAIFDRLFENEALPNVEFYYSHNPHTEKRCDYLLAQPDFAAQYLYDKSQDNVPYWIQSSWAGVESLVPTLCHYPNIRLTGLKDFFGPLIAEYTFNYLLEAQRNSAIFRKQQINQTWTDDASTAGTLGGKTITILGAGSIGRYVAKIAKAFNMSVIGVSRRQITTLENFDLMYSDINDAVADADYVLACLPDTNATKNIICEKTFSRMKRTSTIINVGRGASLHIPDLLTALRSKQIFKAVLDVFPIEPLLPNDPLWGEPNLTITPHIAAISTPTKVAEAFLANLKQIEKGEDLFNLIDVKQGY
jgi:phosphoglycerate dehydrogenase-like enzyme